jgi:uncharacterized membrane protein YgcG
VAPIAHLHDLTPDQNEEIFGDCVTAVREHRTLAMEPQALEWLSTMVTAMMVFIIVLAARDESKLAQVTALTKALIAGGWKFRVVAANFTEWTFSSDGILSATKAEKALKPAKAVASAFLALCRAAHDLAGGGGDDGVGDDPGRDAREDSPPRGPHLSDNLPFNEDDLFNAFNGEDPNLAPDFVRGVTHRSLRGDGGLHDRAEAFAQGVPLPATHQQASGRGFNAFLNCPDSNFEERVVFSQGMNGTMKATTVGADKSTLGLTKLYNKEASRLEYARHADGPRLRLYITFFLIQVVHYAKNPEATKALLEHDRVLRETWAEDGFVVNLSELNASWALALTNLAISAQANLVPAPANHGHHGRGGGGGGGGRAGRNCQGGGGGGRHGGGGGRHGGGHHGGGGGRHGGMPVCRDFLNGKCERANCRFKH